MLSKKCKETIVKTLEIIICIHIFIKVRLNQQKTGHDIFQYKYSALGI